MTAAIKQPGWIRGALGAILGAAFGFGSSSRCARSRDCPSSRPSRPATRTSSCR